MSQGNPILEGCAKAAYDESISRFEAAFDGEFACGAIDSLSWDNIEPDEREYWRALARAVLDKYSNYEP